MRRVYDRVMHHLLGFAIGLLLVFVGKISYDTLINITPPVRTENDAATYWTDGHVGVITYTRDLYVLEDFHGEVSRQLTRLPDNKPQYTVPGSSQHYKARKEPYKVERPFSFEPPLKAGVYCLHATLAWQPDFSIVKHTYDATPVCVEVK